MIAVKIGNKIKVRKDLNTEDLYGGVDVTRDMVKLGGKVITISRVGVSYHHTSSFRILEDGGRWTWTPQMCEPITDDDYIYIYLNARRAT